MYGAEGQLLALNKHSGPSVSETYYYHYNPRGDVVALTDKSGNISASYSYDNWGNPLESKRTGVALENPFRYAGYYFDEETGLYYLMARYYHPTHGVFFSLDPEPGDDDDILTQNGYNYANNNPLTMIDPNGLKSTLDGYVKTFILVIVGGAVVRKVTWQYTKKTSKKYFGKLTKNMKGKKPPKKKKKKKKREHKGTSRNNQVQNAQVRAIANKHNLTASQKRRLHDIITKKNHGYSQIDEIAKDIKRGRW